jgi:hypothetical protein
MDSSEQKAMGVADEKSAAPSVQIDTAELQGYDEKRTRSLLRKLDWHILPFMSLIYL